MSEHSASIHWERQGQDFSTQRYSRRHIWQFDGGTRVVASASPQVVPMPWSDASAVDPEEAFVAALSSCHMLWFLSCAAQASWVIDEYRDHAVGVLARNAQGRLAITTVTLRPEVVFGGPRQPDAAELTRLHHEAHEACFITNSVKTEVRCEPILNT